MASEMVELWTIPNFRALVTCSIRLIVSEKHLSKEYRHIYNGPGGWEGN